MATEQAHKIKEKTIFESFSINIDVQALANHILGRQSEPAPEDGQTMDLRQGRLEYLAETELKPAQDELRKQETAVRELEIELEMKQHYESCVSEENLVILRENMVLHQEIAKDQNEVVLID